VFKQKNLFHKLFSSSKIVGAIKDNINKLIKHKICTVNLSFQKSKNVLSSIKIQAEKGKNL